jgi:hypothetical protein
MKYATVLLFVLVPIAAMAEGNDSLKVKVKPIRYAFTLNSNVLFCRSCTTESSTVALPTTIHGIRWKQVRIGAGVGYTSFGPIRVTPFFGSLTLNLFGKKKQNGVFVEFNYGGAHSWLASHLRNGEFLEDVRASNFSQLSAGYAFHYHGLRLAAQVGVHSLQTTRTFEIGNSYTYTWGMMDIIIPPRQERFDYETTRAFLAISIGI